MTSKVFLGIPSRGYMHVNVCSALINMVMQSSGHTICFHERTDSVSAARNDLVRMVLDREDVTHLLFIDDDTVPPPNVIEELLALDTEIATAVTPIFHFGFDKNANVKANVGHTRKEGELMKIDWLPLECKGVVEVDVCGASCLLIRKEVLQKLDFPWFRWIESEDGKYATSEDCDFCLRVKQLGYRIFANTDLVCDHQKYIGLLPLERFMKGRTK